MKVISPQTISNAVFVASNVTEDDHAVWDVGTTYDADDFVIVTGSTHKVYQSAQGSNTGNDPTIDDGTYWTEIGATNRWKAFDLYLTDQVENSGSITYSLLASGIVTGIAFFGLAATSVRVQVFDSEDPANEIYDQEISIVDGSGVTDWFSFFTEEIVYDTEALFVGLPAYSGFQIDITIDAGAGTAKVGQIVMGKVLTLGRTVEGTSPAFTSYSLKERDAFGRVSLVERDNSDKVVFHFIAPTQDQRRLNRIVKQLDVVPAVWFPDDGMTAYGLMIYGFPTDYDPELSAGGTSRYVLEIEGLT